MLSMLIALLATQRQAAAQPSDRLAAIVQIESIALAGLDADPAPFQSQFALHPQADVVAFDNLGGDALLIAPTPGGSVDAYPHLAAFLRNAPPIQVKSLWQTTSRCVHENLSRTPRWLSTAGFGVAWLHLRLDTRPKYYRFTPYKVASN